MGKRAIHTSLEEDLQNLGLPSFNMAEQAALGGVPLTEEKDKDGSVAEGDDDPTCPKCKAKMEEGKCTKCDHVMESKDEDVDSTNAEDSEGDDPLEGEVVNEELFSAIMELPFEGLQAEDIEEILEKLAEKKLPEDSSEELKERANEVVDFLLAEVAAKVTRRHKAGKMSAKKSFQCPPGTRRVGKTRKCEKAAKVAGGKGKLMKEKRKKVRWGKSGLGAKSQRKSARIAKRREDVDSPFAMELAGLLEDNQTEAITVRDDLLDRVGNIMEMLAEEFADEAVTRVLEEAYEPIAASWDAGRLDEVVMDEDEFIAEIKPVLTLIHKSLEKIGAEEELGN